MVHYYNKKNFEVLDDILKEIYREKKGARNPSKY